jgi:hypothetical protein
MIGLTTMSDFELGDDMMLGMGFGDDAELERAMHRDLARVGGGGGGGELDGGTGSDVPSSKRPRSPYVKWSKEEDDLLAQVCLPVFISETEVHNISFLHTQAVAKHGQKWDLVQKALPSRGYHQVRQRWLRKLGVFDSKPDLSSFQTGGVSFPPGANIVPATINANGQSSGSPGPGTGDSPLPQPKLGLAPLSSELAFSRR